MALSIVTIVIVAGLTYIWVTRGFFSSLLHLVCTIIAGAIAFALWEPLSYWILDSSPTSGFMSFTSGVAWCIGLGVPFAVSLALLRVGVDALLPANVVLNPKIDYIGGGVCGLGSGVITAGILALCLGGTRLDTDSLTQPVTYGAGGSLVRTGGLLFPVDKFTAGIYASLSERSFRTSTPLAKWHPDLPDEGPMLRINAFDGRARNTARSSDFEVKGRFTLGEGGKIPLKELMKDKWAPNENQNAVDLENKPFPESSHIEGFIVEFKAGAKEKDGKIAVGAAQVRLVLENESTDERISVFPIAVSSQADSATPLPARWRYNGKDVYIASVGAASDTTFAFEFIVPPNFKPIGLYVKGTRHEVDKPATAVPKMKFSTPADRDASISTGFGMMSARPAGGSATPGTPGATGGTEIAGLDESKAVKITRPRIEGNNSTNIPPEGMRITDLLPFVIQKGLHDKLELDEENDKNIIITGEALMGLEVLKNRGLEKAIQIQRLLTTTDSVIVQVDVGAGSKVSLVGAEMAGAAPALIDNNGTAFNAVGYTYQDETKVIVVYKPGEPITSMDKLQTLTRSRPAQKMSLIFRCSKNVSIKHFAVGTKVLGTYDPPVLLDQTQGRR